MRNVIWRTVSILLCAAMVLCMIPVMAEPAAAATGYDRGYAGKMAGDGKIYAHGLDVSAWQESGLNFQNFANAGYDYVILRCGTSVGKDKCFEEYYASAKAAGLDVGCYYYSYATSPAEAKAEALEMIEWMGDKVFEYPTPEGGCEFMDNGYAIFYSGNGECIQNPQEDNLGDLCYHVSTDATRMFMS